MRQQTAVSVAEIIAQIVAIDGDSFRFGPLYFADLNRADRERDRIAKQLASGSDLAREIYLEKLKLYRAGATMCSWCECAIDELRHSRAVGDRLLHLNCAHQFDQTYADWSGGVEITAAGRVALENAPDAA